VPPSMRSTPPGSRWRSTRRCKENGISREAQTPGHRSTSSRRPGGGQVPTRSCGPDRKNSTRVRRTTSSQGLEVEAYAKLKPFRQALRHDHGGNSSPLTDGPRRWSSAPRTRRELGLRPLGFLRAYAYAAVDPSCSSCRRPRSPRPRRSSARMAVGRHRLASRSTRPCRPGALEFQPVVQEVRHRLPGRPSRSRTFPTRRSTRAGAASRSPPLRATAQRMCTRRCGTGGEEQEHCLISICAAAPGRGLYPERPRWSLTVEVGPDGRHLLYDFRRA